MPFLGWQVFPDHRRLRRSTGVRLQRQLRVLQANYATGIIQWADVRAVLASWNGHLQYGDTYRLRCKLFGQAVFQRGRPE